MEHKADLKLFKRGTWASVIPNFFPSSNHRTETGVTVSSAFYETGTECESAKNE